MILQAGNRFMPGNMPVGYDSLPVGVYSMHYDVVNNLLFLQKEKDFQLPSKIYDDPDNEYIVERVLNTYMNTNKNVGVMLYGPKGSGKTLAAKQISKASGLPVILMGRPVCNLAYIVKWLMDPAFNNTILFFDEYDKFYKANKTDEDNPQYDLLSLFDGLSNNKNLFILTANNNKLEEHFINRPSRIRYIASYSELSPNVINKVIDDKLKNKDHKQGLLKVINLINGISFDLIISLIEEMNLYKEDAQTSAKKMGLAVKKTVHYRSDLGDFTADYELDDDPYSNIALGYNTEEVRFLKRSILLDKLYYITEKIKEVLGPENFDGESRYLGFKKNIFPNLKDVDEELYEASMCFYDGQRLTSYRKEFTFASGCFDVIKGYGDVRTLKLVPKNKYLSDIIVTFEEMTWRRSSPYEI